MATNTRRAATATMMALVSGCPLIRPTSIYIHRTGHQGRKGKNDNRKKLTTDRRRLDRCNSRTGSILSQILTRMIHAKRNGPRLNRSTKRRRKRGSTDTTNCHSPMKSNIDLSSVKTRHTPKSVVWKDGPVVSFFRFLTSG